MKEGRRNLLSYLLSRSPRKCGVPWGELEGKEVVFLNLSVLVRFPVSGEVNNLLNETLFVFSWWTLDSSKGLLRPLDVSCLVQPGVRKLRFVYLVLESESITSPSSLSPLSETEVLWQTSSYVS